MQAEPTIWSHCEGVKFLYLCAVSPTFLAYSETTINKAEQQQKRRRSGGRKTKHIHTIKTSRLAWRQKVVMRLACTLCCCSPPPTCACFDRSPARQPAPVCCRRLIAYHFRSSRASHLHANFAVQPRVAPPPRCHTQAAEILIKTAHWESREKVARRRREQQQRRLVWSRAD